MADEYGVCRKTFNKLLQKKQIMLDRDLISPKDQMNIYNELGPPSGYQKFPSFPKSSQKFLKYLLIPFVIC